MALLTTQTISLAGITPTFAAAAGGGDTLVPKSYGYLEIKNAGGSSVTLTVVDPRTNPESGVANADRTYTIAATTGNQKIYINPALADPVTGLVSLTYSGVTSVTVGYFSLV